MLEKAENELYKSTANKERAINYALDSIRILEAENEQLKKRVKYLQKLAKIK